MNILFIGDMVGPRSIAVVQKVLQKLKRAETIDLVIANGENIHYHNGINENQYYALLEAGVDVVTLGNHAWDQDHIYDFIDDAQALARPFNYPTDTPGHGYVITTARHRQVAIIAAMGNVMMSSLTSPFQDIYKLIDEINQLGVRHILVDIHAEATSEKTAFAHYLDGKVSAILGTHTHVATSDARILPKGSAYQTDVGMTGPKDSVIGMTIDASVARFVTQRRIRYQQAKTGDYVFHATMVEIGENGLATNIRCIDQVVREEEIE